MLRTTLGEAVEGRAGLLGPSREHLLDSAAVVQEERDRDQDLVAREDLGDRGFRVRSTVILSRLRMVGLLLSIWSKTRREESAR